MLSYRGRLNWLWLIILAVWTATADAANVERPNVVLILIDDLSHYGVTAYGADRLSEWSGLFTNQRISTPNIDRLVEFGWDEFCCFDVVGAGQRFINPNLVINGKVHNYKGRTDLDPATGRRWYGPRHLQSAGTEIH